MKYDDFDNRNYAKWSDFVPPRVLTVEEVRVEEMPRDKRQVPVLWFPEDEFKYGVPLTAKINRRSMASITGSEDPMDAVGVTAEFYADMTVPNPRTGEMGAVRIRKPTGKTKPKRRREPDEEEDFPK
jgi:hypothetical protein